MMPATEMTHFGPTYAIELARHKLDGGKVVILTDDTNPYTPGTYLAAMRALELVGRHVLIGFPGYQGDGQLSYREAKDVADFPLSGEAVSVMERHGLRGFVFDPNAEPRAVFRALTDRDFTAGTMVSADPRVPDIIDSGALLTTTTAPKHRPAPYCPVLPRTTATPDSIPGWPSSFWAPNVID
jgi:hypothetical protein